MTREEWLYLQFQSSNPQDWVAVVTGLELETVKHLQTCGTAELEEDVPPTWGDRTIDIDVKCQCQNPSYAGSYNLRHL